MLIKTHIVFSFFISLLIIDYFNIEKQVLFLFVALLSSLFLDIEKRTSFIAKKTKPFSLLFSFLFKHRCFFHSLTFLFLFSLLLLFFKQYLLVFAFLTGSLSHLFLDAFTKQGIAPFFPLKKRIKGFVVSGSFLDSLIFYVFLFLDLILLFIIY